MNVSKSSSIPLNGPTDGYVLMNDWRWNHDREPSRGGRNVNQKAKKRFSYGQRTKERQRGKNWWSKNVVLLNGCRRWGLRFTVRKRERLLKEGGARRRQLSRVPSVVQGSHAVPPVRFFLNSSRLPLHSAVVVFECSAVWFCFYTSTLSQYQFPGHARPTVSVCSTFFFFFFPPTISSSLAHNTSLQRQRLFRN